MRGGAFFPVPKWVAKKRAVINIQNNDSYCFLYAVLAGLYEFPINPQIKSSYITINCNDPFRGIFNYENFNFPMSLKDIPKFEKLNDYRFLSMVLNTKEMRIIKLKLQKAEQKNN